MIKGVGKVKLQANKAYVIMAQEKTLALGIENGSAENGEIGRAHV